MNKLKNEHNSLLNEVSSKILKPSPIRTKVFNNKEFIKHTEEYFMLRYLMQTPKVAQMVDWQSEPKNVIPITPPPPIPVSVYRFFEIFSVSVYDIEPYLNSQNIYYKAVEQMAANKWQIALPREGMDALEIFKKNNISQIGLQFAQRFDNQKVAMENSLISTGEYTYTDTTLSSVHLDFKHTKINATSTWSDLDTATPLSDLEKVLDIYQDNKMQIGAIFMGKDAARNFLRNKKEIIDTKVSLVGASVIVQSPEVDIEIARKTQFDPYAGYQEIASYRGIPIYMIHKQVEVTLPDHRTTLIETFDTNAVSFVAYNDMLLNKNFLAIHRELNYMDENGTNNVIKEESVAYFGKVDDTHTVARFVIGFGDFGYTEPFERFFCRRRRLLRCYPLRVNRAVARHTA